MKLLLPLFLCIAFLQTKTQVTIEYIAHASFIIEAGDGTRIALDPYNGEHSLGYYYPANLSADAVAVTHPHFDHDASYYFGSQTPVFTRPGDYQVGAVKLRGIEAEHAGAPRFRQRGAEPYNTIWSIEVDGLTIVHLGDNKVLDEKTMAEIGNVDVLLIQIFEDHHYYNDESFGQVVKDLQPSIVIPMHYRLTEISDIPSWTGDVDSWLKKRAGTTHDSNKITINASDLTSTRIVKLQHSPLVKPWGADMRQSWDEFASTRSELFGGNRDFTHLLEQADAFTDRNPEVLIFANLRAQLLDSLGRENDAREVLENALANAGLDDWEQQVIAHSRLAGHYAQNGSQELAGSHYRWILSQERTYRQKLRDKAEAYFEEQK